MNAIRRTAELNARELELVTPPTASWHRDYNDTAFIYIGGLDPRLSEGDVLQIFSQYGEPVWIKLARDRETGKSRGFGWLKYEDQRSCDLAVDNLGGCSVLGRLINVDHTRYKSMRKSKDGEEVEEDMGDNTVPPEDRDRFGNVRVPGDVTEDEEEDEDEGPARPLLKEEKELMEIIRTHDEDDPMKAYLIEQKKEEIEKAKKALGPVKSKSKSKSKDDKHKKRRRHHRSRSPDGEEKKNGDGRDRRQRHRGDNNGHDARRRDRDDDEKRKRRDEDSDEDRSARREEPREHRFKDGEDKRARSPVEDVGRRRRRSRSASSDDRDRRRNRDRRDRD